jgi:hypothetical protein
MRNYTSIALTIVFIAMTIASLGFMTYTLQAQNRVAMQLESAVSARYQPILSELLEWDAMLSPTQAQTLHADGYRLGLHDGYITVFFGTDGTKGIKEVTSTPASALPREEWMRLAIGIEVTGDEELALYLQDYGS